MSEAIPPGDLIGNQQARETCGGITRHTLLAWRRDHGFPEPVAKIDRVEIWDRREVKAWCKAHREVVRAAAKIRRGRRA